MSDSAAVPDDTPTQCAASQYAAKSASNCSTSAPSVNALDPKQAPERPLQLGLGPRKLSVECRERHHRLALLRE